MENSQNKIEEKVMEEIKSGRVHLRSKYIFLAEKLGLGSALVLSVILAVLFFNLALFYLKASDNLGYLSFGSRGLFAFLESFPYLLVVSVILLVFVAGLIVKKSEWTYKKPFGYFALSLIAFVIFCGGLLALTSIAERIESQAFDHHPMGQFFRPFLDHGMSERSRGIVGRVINISDGEFVTIQTPRDEVKIDLKKLENPLDQEVKEGMFVNAVGQKTEQGFEAQMIRIVPEDGMPMIRHGVHRRFGEFGQPPLVPTNSINF